MDQFPTHPNREFFAALQGIKSGDQGSFRRDQGISLSSAIWHSPLVTNPIIGAVGRDARAGCSELTGTERRYGAGGEEMATSSRASNRWSASDAPAERLEQVPRRPGPE